MRNYYNEWFEGMIGDTHNVLVSSICQALASVGFDVEAVDQAYHDMHSLSNEKLRELHKSILVEGKTTPKTALKKFIIAIALK